jgi:hypothetical protein
MTKPHIEDSYENPADVRFTADHAPYSVLEGASTGYGIEPPKGVQKGYAKFDE